MNVFLPTKATILLLIAFLLAFLLSFAATPLVKRLAVKVGAVDEPNERRINKTVMPRMGGLAIAFGFMVSTVIAFLLGVSVWQRWLPDTDFGDYLPLIGILVGALIITVMGVLDDVFQLPAKVKLLIQIVAAAVAVACSVRIDYIEIGGRYINFPFILDVIVTIGWIVAVTNAVNLIDGLDGLAAGVSSISSVAVLCIAVLASEMNVAILTAALAGACLGFLPYNLNPAKLFMGDTGSNFLGYVLATVSVVGFFKGYAIISFVIPFLILGLPIFDTGFAIIRRIVNHKPIMEPDRGHLHHRLLDAGYSQKKAVGILYTICLILCVIAVVLAVILLSYARL